MNRNIKNQKSNMRETKKEKFFRIYEIVYNMTEMSDLPCFSVCDGICENIESAYFLPFEDEFIQRKLKLSKNPFKKIKNKEWINSMVSIEEKGPVEKHCPFSVNQFCTIHEVRPMDCRSFPIIPYFDKSLKFFVAEYCPLKGKVPKNFVKMMKKAWRILFPYVPSWESI